MTAVDRRRLLRGAGALAIAGPAGSANAQGIPEEHLVRSPDEAALRAGLASGARRVRLPVGRITLENPVVVPSGVTLVGAGSTASVIQASPRLSASQAMIEAMGQGITLADFGVDGRAQDPDGVGHGIQISGTGHTLSQLAVRDVAQAGYRLSVSDSVIETCAAINCGRAGHTDSHGFMLYRRREDDFGDLTNVTLQDCRVENAYRKGFALYTDGPSVTALTYRGCSATGCGRQPSSGGGFYLGAIGGARISTLVLRNCAATENYANYEIGPALGLRMFDCTSRDAETAGFIFHALRGFEMTRLLEEGAGTDSIRFSRDVGVSVEGTLADSMLTNANRSGGGFAAYVNLEGASGIMLRSNTFGDTRAVRTPWGLYEGRQTGKNSLIENRLVGRLRAH